MEIGRAAAPGGRAPHRARAEAADGRIRAGPSASLRLQTFLKMAKSPLIKHSDMVEEMRVEAVEISVSAIEKCNKDFEKCSGIIKDDMDKKFGAPWNCVVGEFFGFEITHEVKNLLCLYVGGTICVLLFKSV